MFKTNVLKKYKIVAKTPSDDELVNTLKWMKEVGLVPTGKGKPTLPSRVPSFNVIFDPKAKIYFLVTDLGHKGDVWKITPSGDSEYVSSYTGQYKKQKGQIRYTDANFHDYVELAVIQEIYGILDPEFDDEDDPRHKTVH